MTAPTICTIAALNYLPRVRALHRSLLRTNPGVRFVALVVDDAGRLGVDEAFATIDAAEVVEPVELARMATMYNVLELSTALKPFLLSALQRRFGGPVCYLDPDIVVFGDLATALTPPPGQAAMLTPHCLQPIPRDGLDPHDTFIQAAGSFNLGYCAVADDDRGRQLLAWWSDRLLRECIIDHANHRFTDQRWMDLAVTHFPVLVVRDPTLNVAYWNLHERSLDLEGSTADGVPNVLVDGRPLTFFHFSGFEPGSSDRISRWLERPRFAATDPAWRALAAFYERELATATRPDDARRYGYAATGVGQVLDDDVRRRYRGEVVRLEREMAGLGWTITAGRPPLPAEPPSAFTADGGAAFAEWSGHRGATRRTSTVGAAIAAAGLPPGLQGVNVIGYFGAESGVGEESRALHHALRVVGIPTTTTHVHAGGSRHALPTTVPDSDHRPFEIDLLAVNADQTPHTRGILPRDPHVRATVGFWAWETERLPEHQAGAFDHVDLVLAPSEHAAAAIRATARRLGVDTPVSACPLPVTATGPDPRIGRSDLGLPAGPLVLFCFDHLSVMERKNPLAAIDAYRRAVPRTGHATLVIKTSNAAAQPAEHERLRRAAAERDDVVVIDAYLTPEHIRALMHTADVYLSLHRCEGFGLTVAEAMAGGTAVVTTAYSGTMDFTAAGTAELVPYELVDIPDDTPHYAGTGRWAAPDVDAAADSLARLLGDDDERRALGARGRAHIASVLAPRTIGDRLVRLLDLAPAPTSGGRT